MHGDDDGQKGSAMKIKGETEPDVCSSIIDALRVFEKAFRRFHPLGIPRLHEMLSSLIDTLEIQDKGSIPDHGPGTDKDFRSALTDSADLIIEAIHLFEPTDDIQRGMMNSLKAHRKICRVQEILYPFCRVSAGIDSFFLEQGCNGRVLSGSADGDGKDRPVGVFHKGLDSDPYARGALSMYVPEYYRPSVSMPLVVALHGGFSHGRDFLWTWMREARSRGFILAAPTSLGATWSISNPKADLEKLICHVHDIDKQHHIDWGRILLTGISDGATFALACSLQQKNIFRKIAPVAGVLVPSEYKGAEPCSIFWVHGAQDWMFPMERAVRGCTYLKNTGFEVKLCIVKDLAHAYPREKNAAILEWFDPSLG